MWQWAVVPLLVVSLWSPGSARPVIQGLYSTPRPTTTTVQGGRYHGYQDPAVFSLQDVARRCFCPPGEEALFPCTPYRTALCRPCPAGRYSTSHDHAPCTRCRPCPADRAEVTPCQATHPAVCVERETLRGACMGVRYIRARLQKLDVVQRGTRSQTTPSPGTDLQLPQARLQGPSDDITLRALGIPLLLYLTFGLLVFFLLMELMYGAHYNWPDSFRLSGLLKLRNPVRRQAEYFHAASSCYQIHDAAECPPPAKPTSWLDRLLPWLRKDIYTPITKGHGASTCSATTSTIDFEAAQSRKQRARHVVYCPTSPHELVALDDQGFYKNSFTWEGGTLSHNTVAVTIPKLAIPEGRTYSIRGKTHTDIPNWKQHVNIDHGDVIIAPILECHVEGDVMFSEHVTVCAPHCVVEARNLTSICVYWGDTNNAVKFTQIPHMRHRTSGVDAYYSADEQYVFIHTRHFRLSQFICTIGDRQIALQLQVLVFYDHHLREENQELKLKVKLCDSRNNIPDLRQAYFEQEDMRLVESCSWRKLELPNNEVTSNSEVSIELQPPEDWTERKIGDMRFPLKMTHRLADVLDSRNNVLGEFTVNRTGSISQHFSGFLLLRVTEKIEEISDRSHTVLQEGPGGVIQRTQTSSHTIETNKSCNSRIPIRITLDSQPKPSWMTTPVPLPLAFDYISGHLTVATFPSFYRKLGLTEGCVDAIRERHRDDFREQKMQVLLEWQQRRGKMASAGELLVMLCEIGLRKFAEDLQLEAASAT